MRSIRSIITLPSLVLLAAACLVQSGASGTAPPNGGWDAAWSPDGELLAFTSGSPHNIPNLWVVRPDKSGLKQMTTRGAHEPQWLPDGKTIVFGTIRHGVSAFMSIRADGDPGSETPVEALPPDAEGPVWTKDGSLVAYAVVSKNGASRDLSFARTSGGGKTGLTSNFWCREWAWSPNGENIAFVVGRSAGTSIWVTDLATEDIRLLYKGFCRAPAYSPDGKLLAFAVPDVRSGFQIIVMDLATGKETPISVTSFNGQKILWSPDSRRMFFSSSRKAEPAVWTVGVDGAGLARVTPQGMPAMAPALSPDGKQFVCQVKTKSSYSPEVTVFSAAGRMLTKVTSGSKPSFWAPLWSPDGKAIAFQSDVRHTSGLYTGTTSGRLGAERAVVNGPIRAEVAWLPDSDRLLLTDAGRLLVVKKTGGKDAVTPVPKLTAMVQGARAAGDEIICTEWGLRDATLATFKLDGSGHRVLTQKAVETGKPDVKPQPKPSAPAGPTNASLNRSTGAVISLASNRRDAVVTLVADSATDSASEAEVGNPHASLGIVGPQANRAKDAAPPVIDLWPAVSPNRKTVAFVRNEQVWLVNTDGTGERQITSLSTPEDAVRTIGAPTWSPDGTTLLFQGFHTEPGKMTIELWTCRVAAGSERLIHSEKVDTEFGAYYQDCTHAPAFMAGGKRILFTSVASGEPSIATIGLDGEGLREIVAAPSSFPSLDAAGRTLLYVDLSEFQERIRAMDLATGKTSGPLFRK